MNPDYLKKITLMSVLAFLVLASGCISLEVEQKIHRDGTSEIKTTLDFSSLYAVETTEEMPDINEGLTSYCNNFFDATSLTNPYCTPMPEEYKVVSGGSFSLKDNPSFTFDGIRYRYDVKGIQALLSEATEAQGQELSLGDVEQIKSIASTFGMDIKYIVEMPGAITKSDVGEINGNRVVIDFFDLYESDHIYIESQETGGITGMFTMEAATISAVALAVIVIVLFFFYKKSRRSRRYHGYDLNKIKKGLR